MGSFLSRLRGTSLEAMRKAWRHETGPLYEQVGVVEAPLDTVTSLLTSVRPGNVGPDNAFLVHDGNSSVELEGGEGGTYTGKGLYGTVQVDRDRRTFATQGGWWFRGEFSAEPHPRGTRLRYRVYNAAEVNRRLVPFVQFGIAEAVRRSFAESLTRIGAQLGVRTDPEGGPADPVMR